MAQARWDILKGIITWLLCFSPASIDSSPASTDSSPVSTDSSLLTFLLLEPPPPPRPLQSKCTLVNKMCIVLYFEIILFHFIWNEYLSIKKNTLINSEDKCFPQKHSWHQSKTAPVSFQCHRLSTVIHRQWQESVKCCNLHAKGPSEITVVQISPTDYVTKCYRKMVDQIPQKRILRPEINGNPTVYIGDLTFESVSLREHILPYLSLINYTYYM